MADPSLDATLDAGRPATDSRPPATGLGPLSWMRRNLFSSPFNTGLTILILLFLAWIVPKASGWLFVDAVWGRQPLEACDAVRGQGACWAVVAEKFRFMMFGVYPFDEQWRPAIAIGVLCVLLVVSALKAFWSKWLAVIWIGGIAVTFWLMGGGLGLTPVKTEQWGGLPVTLILAIFGIGFAFPLGVLLALGRRSQLPLVRSFCGVYIEVIRGVPLITLLFMGSVMFALVLTEGVRIEQLLRAQVAIIMFIAAYLAEAVRGGLQAVPKGQYEAAEALGLPYWKSMGLIVLPQALRISIPPIVNSFISLFKDTSLVVIIGIYDFAYAVKKSVETDFSWKKYFIEAFLFSIVVYWIFCFAMSKYSQKLERDLARGHHR
ncbi:MAG: amino acid ABC transporter permease [Burkholderiales bacterium]|nr:MAG: amino acid ABC transporter permease [Burkholderiales bacterium]